MGRLRKLLIPGVDKQLLVDLMAIPDGADTPQRRPEEALQVVFFSAFDNRIYQLIKIQISEEARLS